LKLETAAMLYFETQGMNKRVLLFSALFLTFCLNAPAQQSSPSPAESQNQQDVNKDEVLILVNIKADSLRFEAVPNTKVEFPGTHTRSRIWMTDRQNLPDQVEPGVTYRNIGLQLRISTRFTEIERIVREAFGDVTSSVNDSPITTTQPNNITPAVSAETQAIKPTAHAKPPPPKRKQRKK
jgi:hypothetical protein